MRGEIIVMYTVVNKFLHFASLLKPKDLQNKLITFLEGNT